MRNTAEALFSTKPQTEIQHAIEPVRTVQLDHEKLLIGMKKKPIQIHAVRATNVFYIRSWSRTSGK